jgi:uncharacterized repeat protein (TIGR04138 family)
VYDPEEFFFKAEEYLKKSKSKYTLLSLQVVVTIINEMLATGNKLSIEDITYLGPPAILRKFGYLWDVVLRRSNIISWDDFGNVVFICVDLDIFKANDEDKLEDFVLQEKKLPLLEDCKLLEVEGYITSFISKKQKTDVD